ncbi:MAG: DUF5333 domain-containing protein [Paracoccaceae bacterium]
MRIIIALTLTAAVGATSALSKPSLRDVATVEEGLFVIAVADKIRKECGSISGRVLKAMSQMQQLNSFAQDQGYSSTEIKTYVNSDVEKTRMKAKRDAYLTNQGVVKSDPSTYCAAGRAEIQKSSRIGALLRAR